MQTIPSFRFNCIWFLFPLCFLLLFHHWLSAFISSRQKIIFCQVGQGDATVLLDGDAVMVVDGGPDESVLSCLQKHLPPWKNSIELLVLTHADADHFGGFKSILDHYWVKQLLLPTIGDTSSEFYDFYLAAWREAEKDGTAIVNPRFAQSWCLGEYLCCHILSNHHNSPPENIWRTKYHYKKLFSLITEHQQLINDKNSLSIVLNCQFDHKNILLTGDISEAQELSLLNRSLLMKVDILKVAHHGSKSSSSWNFLQEIRPEHSAIMCGRNNPYQHPHQQTLAALAAIGSQLWRTDVDGTIVFARQRSGNWLVTSDRSQSLLRYIQ